MEEFRDLINVKNLVQVAVIWVIVYWILRYLETTIAGAFLRTAGLIAHLAEEVDAPIGFALSYQAARDSEYTGAMPEGVSLRRP